MSNMPSPTAPPLQTLLGNLGELIREARKQALRAVDTIQVQACWQIGRHIVEFEQGGEARAAYGKRLLPELAKSLTREFGKGFDASNLRYMRLFYQAFPMCDALRHELSWTHYRLLLRIESDAARRWHMDETKNLFSSTKTQNQRKKPNKSICYIKPMRQLTVKTQPEDNSKPYSRGDAENAEKISS